MGSTRADVEATKKRASKFIRYKEGAEMYCMSQSKFERLAKDANACYKIDKLVLVNMEILDRYLETFRIVEYQWAERDLTHSYINYLTCCITKSIISIDTGGMCNGRKNGKTRS